MGTLLLALSLLLALPAAAQTNIPLPLLPGQAFHILPPTHNQESGYFSLAEGLDGRLYVGTAKYGVGSSLVELDPVTGAQRVVIDTHQLGNYAGVGFAAQAKLHTRNFVAPSGRVYVGSKQGYPEKGENPWSYPGGFLMSYDPRTDAAQNYGMIPHKGYGVIDIVADESRGLIYYVACEDNSRDHVWGVYDTRAKRHRLLGPRVCLYGSTLLDAKGRVYVLTSEYKLAGYDPESDQLTVRDVLLNGQPFEPAPGTTIHEKLTTWVLAPDGQTAYLLMLTNPTLFGINLAGAGPSTTATDLGRLLATDKPALSYSGLALHPDGGVYALLVTPDPAGRAKGNVNVLVRYDPKTKTSRLLGVLAIRNKDYFDFRPLPDGQPQPWSNGVETLADGTLVPTAVHQGMIAGRDGTLYVLLISPFAVLKLDAYRVPAPGPTPARLWVDEALALCDRIDKNLPAITGIAEAAAQRYLAGGRLDVILNTKDGWPGQGPQAEICGRSGGLINLGARYVPDPEDKVRPAAEQTNDVIIIGWQRAPSGRDAERIKIYRDRGAKILGFGPRGLPALAECEKLCDWWIDTGYGADDRVVMVAGGRRVGRGNSLANLLDGWVFIAEFVGALTRQGKMPPLWKAMLWKNDWEPWSKKYQGKMKFHDDLWVPPLGRGVLGKRFLDRMRWHFRKFGNTQLDQVRKAAQLVAAEHAQGKQVAVTVAGHCLFDTVGQYEDGVWAHEYSFHGWVPYETRDYLSRLPKDHGSLVLVLAYCGFPKEQWATLMGTGQNRILLLTCETNPQEMPEFDGPKDECQAIIDMGHAYGDACTRIEGYPFPVFPPSGIMQALAYEAVNVEALAKIGADAKPAAAAVKTGP